ncbi:MAG: hypothetical protein JWQ57_4161 [Mucilaginibacter sp.]|nr:hypothetical protein [Mucilaginibacter sp.]
MEASHNQLQYMSGVNAYFFAINSNNLHDDIKFIKENKIKNIELNDNKGWQLDNIYPLIELDFVEGLYIHTGNMDLSKISHFKNLQLLSISEDNYNIDLSSLKKLTFLSLKYQRNLSGLDFLLNLEKLNLIKADAQFFNIKQFDCWPKLRFLQLLSPKLPNNLSFLTNCKKLKHFEMHYCRTMFSIRDLSCVKDTLEELSISNCKKVEGLEVLSELKNLKRLSFVDSVPLNDISFTKRLTKLEILVVIGSSFFKNGNIKSLKGKIKYISIDNKKHYDIKFEDFKN